MYIVLLPRILSSDIDGWWSELLLSSHVSIVGCRHCTCRQPEVNPTWSYHPQYEITHLQIQMKNADLVRYLTAVITCSPISSLGSTLPSTIVCSRYTSDHRLSLYEAVNTNLSNGIPASINSMYNIPCSSIWIPLTDTIIFSCEYDARIYSVH